MPPTYTTNLSLHKPATGEEAGIWGQTVNTQLDFLDRGIDGSENIPLSASSYDLLTSQDVDSIARKKVLNFSGTLGADGSIIIKPNTAQKIYFVTNSTAGGFALNFSQGTGPVFKLLNGRSAIIYSNGLGGSAGVFGALNDLQVNSLLVQTSLILQAGAAFSGLATFPAGATIAAPLTINLGGDAPYDLYYRLPGGTVGRLPIGSNGQVLTVAAGSLSWAAPPGASIGMAVAGAAGNQILFVNAGLAMAQDVNLQWVPSTGLGLGMAPQKALSVGGTPAVVQINAVPAGARGVLFTTNNLSRWSLETSTDSEGGGNAGCSFVLRSANDAGSSTLVNLASYRSGRTTVGNVLADIYGSQFTTVNTSASTYIQAWVNSSGVRVASLDNNGIFVSATGGGLALNGQNRLDINGVVSGHPLGTLHLGKDLGSGPSPSVVLEGTTDTGSPITGGQSMRIYVRTAIPGFGPKLVIQYSYAGTPYWAWIDLTQSSGPAAWNISNSER